MRIKKRIVMFIVAMIFSLLLFLSFSSNIVYANEQVNKVLFYVQTQEILDSVLNDCEEEGISENFYEVDLITNLNIEKISSYKVVAIPYGFIKDKVLFDNNEIHSIIYLYGDLTIAEYKEVTNLDEFALEITAKDSNNSNSKKVKQFFDSEFEQNQKFNIISFWQNALLCKIDENNKDAFTFFYSIFENCKRLIMPKTRTTILESKFDFTTNIGNVRVYGIAHMDYTLFRNYEEEDLNYDYFGIKTKTWVTTKGSVKEIYTKYSLSEEPDNLLETGPASVKNAGNISVSVGFGANVGGGTSVGVSGSIGYTVDLSNYKPTINRTEDFLNDTVSWNLTPSRNISSDGLTLDCVATWACLSSLGETAINVDFKGDVWVEASFGHRVVSGTLLQVPIRLKY